jgi:hypothetical protein
MSNKKKYKTKPQSLKVNELLIPYGTNRIKIFNSFEEQAEYELEQMAKLSSTEILLHLRKLINLAYGMHGFNLDNLPKKHSIKIIS